VRLAGRSVVARGKFGGFRIRVAEQGDLSLTVNGKQEPAVVRDGFLVYGDAPAEDGAAPAPGAAAGEPAESRASVVLFLRDHGRSSSAGTGRRPFPTPLSAGPQQIPMCYP